jgi:peptidoglycan/xylan/chitin deacetylase (PgdA/CDA1 family)
VQKTFRLSGIPVLAYHGLTRQPRESIAAAERHYWLHSEQFRSHLDHIRRGGYRLALLNDFWKGDRTTSSPETAVVVTFDDGLASDYEVAYPLLAAAGAQAEFFLNTSTIGQQRYLSWQQIREMQKAGLSFQSHSHDHVDLTRLGIVALERQLRASKELLEDRLGSSVRFFSVPYGLLNRRVVDAARQVGYRAVCGTCCWPARPGADVIARVVLRREYTLEDVRKYLERRFSKYASRLARRPLYFPRWLLVRFRPERVGVAVLEGKR